MMEYKISHGLTQINSTYDFFPITPKILTFNNYIFVLTNFLTENPFQSADVSERKN